MRYATYRDAEYLADRLRPADLNEINAASGRSPGVVLRTGVQLSNPCLVVVDREDSPVAMFGVVPDGSDELLGHVWLLGSRSLRQVATRFLRESRKWVDTLNDLYPVLTNHVDERNTLHIRWMDWLGFAFINRKERHGVAGMPFLEFVRINHV